MTENEVKLIRLAQMRRWTELMAGIPEGDSVVIFPDTEGIKSFKALAYDHNSDRKEYSFSLSVDKESLEVRIRKTRRDAVHEG